jgi:hypothetical protein
LKIISRSGTPSFASSISPCGVTRRTPALRNLKIKKE